MLLAKQFSFLVDIFVVMCFDPVILPVGLWFRCCFVVSFVIPFRIGINAILYQLLLLFLAVPLPLLHNSCHVEMQISAGLYLSFWYVHAGVSLAFSPLHLFCLFLFDL